MELVTEPVMHDAKTVGDFARELQLVLRTLGISDANMERGEMRVEANISISPVEGELGTKVEVKNLNSFKAVEAAIDYEIKRHTEVLEKGGELAQETRGWDENTSKTFSQRSKETAKDYRYFPDPDIPKIKVSEITSYSDSSLSEKIPTMPNEKREFLSGLGLSSQMTETLIQDIELSAFYDAVLEELGDKTTAVKTLAANYVSVDLVALPEGTTINPEAFAQLMIMTDAGDIGSKGAKTLLPKLIGFTGDVAKLAEDEGVVQNSSPEALQELVATIISENPDQVAQFKGGKEAILKYLVGQGMKLSKGSANPAVLEQLLSAEILK